MCETDVEMLQKTREVFGAAHLSCRLRVLSRRNDPVPSTGRAPVYPDGVTPKRHPVVHGAPISRLEPLPRKRVPSDSKETPRHTAHLDK